MCQSDKFDPNSIYCL